MKTLYLSLICLAMALVSYTQTNLTQIDLVSFASGFNNSIGIYSAGDDRMFILEQNQSDIEIVDLNGNYIGTFLDLSALTSTGGERGLLGLAFHPNYQVNGKFYVNYTNSSGDTVIAEYSVSGDEDVADASSGVILMTITQDFSNHNGGHIAFGPDGYLYIGMGDGGSGGDPNNRAQTLSSLLGKMLRINVPGDGTYSSPADNPYVGDGAVPDEIWSLGLRNPWKFSFDALTGDMWIGDVGQNQLEEIDMEPFGTPGGTNYGWRCMEGFSPYNNSGCGGLTLTDPVADYSHGSPYNFCSITGGIVYRGSTYDNMYGHYFFTDYCDGSIYTLYPDGVGGFVETEVSSDGNFGYVAFGEDVNKELYLVDNGGTIYKVTDPCDYFDLSISSNGTELTASTADNYQWYLNGNAIASATNSSYTPVTDGEYYCKGVNNDGCVAYSNSLNLAAGGIYVLGCTQECSSSYNPLAQIDDGSCIIDYSCGDCPGDFTGDNAVTIADLTGFLAAFGGLCD